MALDDKEQAALEAKLKAAEDDADKWKGLARKHEDRSKENADAAAELEKLKASKLSDEDRRKQADDATAKELADLKSSLDEEKKARVRAEVAASKGLTPAQAKRLSGSTQEELEADADDILENFKPVATAGDDDTSTKVRPATRPKTSVTGGGDPTTPTTVETDPAKLAADLPRF